MMTMAMSVRILFTTSSHDRYWSVGSLPYLPCHLATCAFAGVSGSLATELSGKVLPCHSRPTQCSLRNPSEYPCFEVLTLVHTGT
jgi:hypothetical protein